MKHWGPNLGCPRFQVNACTHVGLSLFGGTLFWLGKTTTLMFVCVFGVGRVSHKKDTHLVVTWPWVELWGHTFSL